MASQNSDLHASANDLHGLSYEQAVEELEGIVAAMDGDRLPLEEMISKYDRGTQLLKICQQRLQAAQHRVELIQAGKNGAEITPLPSGDAAATSQPTTSPSPAKARRTASKAQEPDDDNEIRLF